MVHKILKALTAFHHLHHQTTGNMSLLENFSRLLLNFIEYIILIA